MMKPVLALATASILLIASVTSSAFAETKKKASAEKRAPSAAQLALRDRQKKCGAEWKEAKAAGKTDAGMKWPQYWSACNKRLKGT
jgi:hypothetical protein